MLLSVTSSAAAAAAPSTGSSFLSPRVPLFNAPLSGSLVGVVCLGSTRPACRRR